MKKYTQKKFDDLPVDKCGIKQCPTGDYSVIKTFEELCSFGERSGFGEGSSFARRCSFGRWCSFGEKSSFGESSSFGMGSIFGESSSFGKLCGFGEGSIFGRWCSFGKLCSFGERNSFGVGNSFEKWCSFGEGSSFGKECRAISPYWSFVYEPPFQTTGGICPPATTRDYWAERLNVNTSGCYEDIQSRLKPLLPEILKRTDLTKCERRILESWL